jgi:hypothetical protein
VIRRLLPLLGVAIAITLGAQTANAITDGLTVTGYHITETPPSKNTATLQQCGQETAPNINIVYEYDPIGQCPDDLFLAHYQGFLTLPAGTVTVRFWLAADDGGTMKIGLDEFGDWTDKGCSAVETDTLTLPDNVPLILDGWFYENGGGTCFMFGWSLNNGPLEIIPPSAFTSTISQPATTTTTLAPVTTTTNTTTTSTTTTSTTTTSTTTTTAAPQTTTPATTSTQPPTTTTVKTTAPSTSIQETTSTTSTVIVATSSSSPTTTSSPQTTLPPTTTTTISSTTTVPFESVIPIYTEAEAVTIALDPVAVAQLTEQEAEAVFETINVDDLTEAQADALVAAVQEAPTTVREAFEDKINVFAGATDSYIPLGSTVPVSTRRVIIITSTLLVATPITRRK